MRAQSPFERLKASFLASAGDVVFGMEDGTVSIFGLVFGVAATTDQRSTVLIAGASGAVAAAVSMMAGTYLDVETRRDAAKAASARMKAEVERNPAAVLESVTARFRAAGLSPDKADSLANWLSSDKASLKSVAGALDTSAAPDASQGPLVQSFWMLGADFLAAAIPIVPFALLPVAAGRVVSGTVTFMLLIGLGIGRAGIGGRSVLPTVVETVSIGVAAALAGVAIGTAIARAFGV